MDGDRKKGSKDNQGDGDVDSDKNAARKQAEGAVCEYLGVKQEGNLRGDSYVAAVSLGQLFGDGEAQTRAWFARCAS
jgi:hypothetical protein